LASEAHEELHLPYVDPHTASLKRKDLEAVPEQTRSNHPEAFAAFVDAIRKNQPFLQKATEAELEGIFARLTPAERKQYTAPSAAGVPATSKKPKTSLKEEGEKPKKKVKTTVSNDFINDEAEESDYENISEDISLVSESELEAEPEEQARPKKEKLVSKRKLSESKERHTGDAAVKKFTWT
jgi:hypothetical protein